jgi:tetratricopeptide (TPR) repeat protein
MRRRLASIAMAASLLAAPVAFAQGGGGVDVIKLKGDKEVKGKIIEVTSEKVSYAPPGGGGGQLSESLDAVVDIVFFDAPFGVSKGDSLLKEGKPDEAIPQYQKALEMADKNQVRALHKQYALFGIARSHQASGNWGEAVSAYRRLLKDCPTTRFKFEAYDGAISSAQRKGDNAAIDDMIGKMKGEKDPRIAAKAELAIGLSALQAGKFGDARDRFSKLTGDKDPLVQASAQIGLIRCLVAEKKTDDLKKQCDLVIRGSNDTPALLAAAYTAIGDMNFAQAGEKKDAKVVKDALLAYLRTVVRYFPPAGETSEDYEKALFQAGVCFAHLREGMQKPESKKEYADRAAALFEELLRDHKGSPWAAKAQEQMKALKK